MTLRLIYSDGTQHNASQRYAVHSDPAAYWLTPVRYVVDPDGQHATGESGERVDLRDHGIYAAEPGTTMWWLR